MGVDGRKVRGASVSNRPTGQHERGEGMDPTQEVANLTGGEWVDDGCDCFRLVVDGLTVISTQTGPAGEVYLVIDPRAEDGKERQRLAAELFLSWLKSGHAV